MKIGVLKVIGVVFLLAEELTKAAKDGEITAEEGLAIIAKLCESLDITFLKQNT